MTNPNLSQGENCVRRVNVPHRGYASGRYQPGFTLDLGWRILLEFSRKPNVHFLCPYEEAADALVSHSTRNGSATSFGGPGFQPGQ